MKSPKNFYNNVDQKKLGLDELFDRVSANEDAIEELNTNVVANVSDDNPTKILNNIKIGNEVYLVNEIKPILQNIKHVRVTVATNVKGTLYFRGSGFYSIGLSNYYTFTSNDTVKANYDTWDIDRLKNITGGDVHFQNVEPETPVIIEYYFNNGIDLDVYNIFRMRMGNALVGNHYKVEISVDGVDYVNIIDDDMSPTQMDINDICTFTNDVVEFKKTLNAGETSMIISAPNINAESNVLVLDDSKGIYSNSLVDYSATYSNNTITFTFTAMTSNVNFIFKII